MLNKKKVALATASHLPNGAKDTQLLLEKINNKGLHAEIVIWNDEQVDWKQYDVVYLHTAWDYILHVEAFRTWIKQIDNHSSLINATELILWNMDKRYLLDLQEKGIAIPDTSIVESGSLLQNETHDYPVVIKKVVSAGGRGNWLCKNQTEIAYILEQGNLWQESLLVQQYEPSIETKGEYSAVYLSGSLQFVIQKLPRQGEFRVQSQYGGSETLVTPTASMIYFCDKVLHTLPSSAKYARVDFIEDNQNVFKLMEVELIEPDLFLRYDPNSFDQFIKLWS